MAFKVDSSSFVDHFDEEIENRLISIKAHLAKLCFVFTKEACHLVPSISD